MDISGRAQNLTRASAYNRLDSKRIKLSASDSVPVASAGSRIIFSVAGDLKTVGEDGVVVSIGDGAAGTATSVVETSNHLSLGAGAGAGVTTGEFNTLIGISSYNVPNGSENSTLGAYTMYGNNGTCNENTMVGYAQGAGMTDVSRCTFVGNNHSLYTYNNVVDSILIGSNTSIGSVSGKDRIAIGAWSNAVEDNQCIIGASSSGLGYINSIVPGRNGECDLGSVTNKFKDVHASGSVNSDATTFAGTNLITKAHLETLLSPAAVGSTDTFYPAMAMPILNKAFSGDYAVSSSQDPVDNGTTYYSWHAFDNVPSSRWSTVGGYVYVGPGQPYAPNTGTDARAFADGTPGDWIQITMGIKRGLSGFKFQCFPVATDEFFQRPKSMVVKTSHDDVTWVDVLTIPNVTYSTDGWTPEYTFTSDIAAQFIAFVVTGNSGAVTSITQFAFTGVAVPADVVTATQCRIGQTDVAQIVAGVSEACDLGGSTRKFRDIYMSGGITPNKVVFTPRAEPLAPGIDSPVAGLLYYDSTTNRLRIFNGSTWSNLALDV